MIMNKTNNIDENYSTFEKFILKDGIMEYDFMIKQMIQYLYQLQRMSIIQTL